MVRLSNIQFLRFFAAMMVVTSHIASHVPLLAGHQESSFWDRISIAGSYGVDIFFVISGFVITNSFRHQKKSPSQFLKLRFFRIYPLYAAVTILFFLMHLVFPSMANSSKISIRLLLSSLTLTSRIFGFPYPILPQGWTLEIEVFFYLIFVASIILCLRLKSFSGKEGLLSGVFILLAIIFGAPNLMIEFVFGTLISIYSGKTRKMGFILLAAIGFFIFIWINIAIDIRTDRYLWIGLPSALLVFLAIATPQLPRRFMNFLGDISYSIYLIHGIIIAVLLRFFTGIHEHSILIFSECVFALVVVIAGCTYLFFERPLVLYSKNRWGKSIDAKKGKGIDNA